MERISCYVEHFKEKLAVSVDTKFFLMFLCVRLSSIFVVQTWYVPDEFWQSMEVAHSLVFGYGNITWEWVLGLRSYLHPLIIAVLYKVLYILNLDSLSLLIIGPRICQAVLSAYADLKFYHWSGNHKWAAFVTATSWFWYYTASRTLINTLESCLTTIALSQFPWPGRENGSNRFLWWVAVACAARPTAAIMWLPLCVYHVASTERAQLKRTVLQYAAIGLAALALSICVDSLCHGQLVVTSWQFLKFNVLHDVASWYGTQPWHWYLSCGLPAVLGIYLLPFTLAVVHILRHRQERRGELILLGAIMFAVTVLSVLPHKEFRFLLVVLPAMLYLSAAFLSRWSCKAARLHIWLSVSVLLVSNVLPAAYLGTVHQRGTMDVMEPLAQLAAARPNDTSFLFLMPCHSTPLYSHLHVPVTVRFLTCEPQLGDHTHDYKDEADVFYENPNKWLHGEYPPNGTLPSHIVTFDTTVPNLSSILSRYKLLHRLEHTGVPLSSRIGHHVVVYQHSQY